MKFKAVIFDLDGTLLDTIVDIKNTMNLVLDKYHYPQFSVDDYKYFVGDGVDKLILRIIETAKINLEMFETIKKDYYEVYKQQSKVHTKIYDGIELLLKKLKALNISINVLSNKPHIQTIDVINYYFDSETFTCVYGKKDEFLPKPANESAINMLDQLGLSNQDILYVGDTSVDILTAKNSGFKSVGVLWGFRKESELRNAGADYIVSEPKEILDIITS